MRQRPFIQQFAKRPQNAVCALCDKRISRCYYWEIPVWYRIAHNYGDARNDLHCDDCHQRMIKEDGRCTWCGATTEKGE